MPDSNTITGMMGSWEQDGSIMNAVAFIICCIFASSVLVLLMAVAPQHIIKRLSAAGRLGDEQLARRLRSMKGLMVGGEVLLIGAFVVLYEQINHAVLYPAAMILASTLVGFRYMLRNVSKALGG